MDLIETLAGKGQVFRGDKRISEVLYDINVYQERIDTSSHDGPSSIPGLKTATLGLNHHVGDVGEKLTLVLEDGRKMDFFVMNHNNNYQPTGPIE